MMWFTVLKAIAARSLFAIHAFVAVWRVVDIRGGDPIFWLLASTIGLLFIEGFISICLRSGREMKWFCPSVFLYLCCIIPPTWMMELDLVYVRRHLAAATASSSSATPSTPSSSSLNITTTHRREKLSQIPGLQITIDLELPAEMWAKLLEQFLLVNLVLGRWLLPKGGLTRGQLSQLLLVYIGMAADIVELFEAFKEDVVNTNLELTCAVLALWSWSLMQFTLVLTATKARKPRLGLDNYVSKDYKNSSSSNEDEQSKCCAPMKRFCAMDTWAIMTTIIFQDGPFLCLRLLLIIKYNVVYRMSVLSIESRKVKKLKLKCHQPLETAESPPHSELESAPTHVYCPIDIEQPKWSPPPPKSKSIAAAAAQEKKKKKKEVVEVEVEEEEEEECKFKKKKSKCAKKKRSSAGRMVGRERCNELFDEDDRDSVLVSYSQNKSAPWSDVSFTLSSSSASPRRKLFERPAITNVDSSCESDIEPISHRLKTSINRQMRREGNQNEKMPLITV